MICADDQDWPDDSLDDGSGRAEGLFFLWVYDG